MAVTPNLNLPLLDSEEKVSEDHLKINQFVEALDTRLGEVLATIEGLAEVDHAHEMAKVNGLADALELLARIDHSHKLHELADVDVEDAPDGKILQKIAGKWGLGDRGYSVPEINNIVAELASDDHKHPIADVDGLADKLAKFADATKNAKFNQDLSVGGDVYLNNKAIISNDSDGEFADRSGENIDHVYHDDGDNAWHFVSDGAYRETGNSKLVAGRVDLLNTKASLTSSDLWLSRSRFLSTNTADISSNRSSNCILAENKQYAPANATDENGARFHKRGLFAAAYADGNSPGKTYEAFGALLSGRQRGSSDVRSLAGCYSQSGTETSSTGEVDYLYGARTYSFVNGKGRVGTHYGMHVSINPNTADAHVSYPRGLYIHMDYDAGTIDNDAIAMYQNFDGNWNGQRRIGIYQNDVQYNYLTGKTHVDGHEVVHMGNLEEKGLGEVPSPFFTSSTLSTGTWNKPSGFGYFSFELRGGDGGVRSGKSPGGAGGVVKLFVRAKDLPNQLSITVGGAGRNSSSSSSTRHGGDTTVSGGGINMVAGGGVKNSNHGADTGAGGSASGGDINVPGVKHGGSTSPRAGSVIVKAYKVA